MTYFFGEFVVTIWGPYDFGTSTPTPWFCHNLRGQKSSSSQFPRGWRGRGWGTHGAPVYHLGRGTCAGLAESGLQKPLQKGFILHIWAISYRGLSWSQAKWWFLYTRNLPQSCSEVSWDTLKSEVCKKFGLPTLTPQNQRESGLKSPKTWLMEACFDWIIPLHNTIPVKKRFLYVFVP